MFALIGLGNPGDKYSMTRHNIGYLERDRNDANQFDIMGESTL